MEGEVESYWRVSSFGGPLKHKLAGQGRDGRMKSRDRMCRRRGQVMDLGQSLG